MPKRISFWKCKNNHILGQVAFDRRGYSQLLVFREALDLSGEVSDTQDIVAVLEGYTSATVRCSQCLSIRTWVAAGSGKR